MLSEELGIPSGNVIPTMNGYNACASSLSPGLKMAASSSDNPAARLGCFFKTDFLCMSCGGVILSITRSKEHFETLRNLRPVSRELVRKYIRAWRESGFYLSLVFRGCIAWFLLVIGVEYSNLSIEIEIESVVAWQTTIRAYSLTCFELYISNLVHRI